MNNIELIKEYQLNKDNNLLNKIVEENIGLVKFTVNKFNCSKEYQFSEEDLMQEGYIGLIKAIKKFNTDEYKVFSTYAIKVIWGTMSRYIQKNYREEDSLYEEVYSDSDSKVSKIDLLQDDEDKYQPTDENIYNNWLHDRLDKNMEVLDNEERYVIEEKYYKQKTFKDIAAAIKKDWGKLVRAEGKAMRKLRQECWKDKELYAEYIDLECSYK